ncbi:MAG: hypothetical protein ABW061_09050 [Polyangiaceae bacterium]
MAATRPLTFFTSTSKGNGRTPAPASLASSGWLGSGALGGGGVAALAETDAVADGDGVDVGAVAHALTLTQPTKQPLKRLAQ